MKFAFIHVRRMRIIGCVVLIFIGGGWGLGVWVSDQIESVLAQGLRQRGLEITWEKSTWNPIQGTRLSGVKITQSGGSRDLLAELENLNLHVPLSQFLAGDERITYWKVHDSNIIIHDDEGSVNLQHISLKLVVARGKIEVDQLNMEDKALIIKLTGTILTGEAANLPKGPLKFDLTKVRESLAMLVVGSGTGPFRISGNFIVHAADPTTPWKARLKGRGEDLEWKGVRYGKVSADAELSSRSSVIHCDFLTANGSCGGIVAIPGESDTALTFEGRLKDFKGRENPFCGRYQKDVLTVESIAGDADLLAIAKDVPGIAKKLPDGVTFESFPRINARNIRKSGDSPWTVESLEIANSKTVGFTVAQQRLNADGLSAKLAFDGDEWKILSSTAKMMGGEVSIKGRYRNGTLSQSTLIIENIRASELKRLANGGKSKNGRGILSGRFQGAVDFRRERLDGGGSIHMNEAPIIEVPLLDQVYELFAAMISGVKRSRTGEFNADFKAHGDTLVVTKFQARGGAALTVSAEGTVDLDKHLVSGHARGKLVGLPGVLTSPLSRLLEMDVAGPYDNIRVIPLGPVKLASNAASGSVEVPLDVLEETGRITGTLLKEGIKLPFEWMREKSRAEEKTEP